VLAACLATGCAAFDPHGILTRRALPGSAEPHSPFPDTPRPMLDAATRQAAIDFVWTTVNERYYDPAMNGTDWAAARSRWAPRALAAGSDDAFWDLLDRMTGELRDAHTRVESPKRAELIERDQAVGFGFTFQPLGERLVVTSARGDGDAYWAGVRPGMTLVAIGGRPAMAAYSEALAQARQSSTPQARSRAAARRLVEGDAGGQLDFAFERGDGTRFEATLKRARFGTPPGVTHRVLPSGVGYVRLTQWDFSVQSRMLRAIAALKDTPGLVVDLRGNPGGSGHMVRKVAEQFVQGKVAAGRTITRTGKPVTLGFGLWEVVQLKPELEGTGTYKAPVAVLVNEASASGSEMFAGLLRALGRATIVGTPTCGCLLAYLGYADVPGGGKLAYSEVGFEFPDGKRIEGEGVLPDVAVPLSVADLLAGRDRALEAAQDLLRRKGRGTADERR